VEDPRRRSALETAAIKGTWSRRQLKGEIRALAEGELGAGKTGKNKGGLKRPTDAAYVYGCWVERVVDGDTLIVQLDLGFEVIRRQRLRLAGVDVAEEGPESRAAYRYVLEQLGRARRLVMKTSKQSDAYGRYVGFVFYGMQEEASVGEVFARGRFLNGELVDKGLGKRVML